MLSKKGVKKIISLSGPFEALSRREGRLSLLRDIGKNPEGAALRLSDEAEHILDSLKLQLAADDKFETAWIGSDLAYKDSLFFSINFYKKYLFPIHKKLIGFLKAHNLSVMFHSDGKIDELLPYFVEAGVSGLDRLDRYADMDISGIKKQYRDKLEFFN